MRQILDRFAGRGVQLTWHQELVGPFDQPEFYAPGPVVAVVVDGGQFTVDRDGEALLVVADRELRTPEEFRAAFANGTLPDDGDGVEWVNNAWFGLYGPAGEPVGDLDAVAYSLLEAVDDAAGRLVR